MACSLHIDNRSQLKDNLERNKMRNLIRKLFKSEPQFNYILAEYQPGQQVIPPKELPFTEDGYSEHQDKDEMEIDRLYQNN